MCLGSITNSVVQERRAVFLDRDGVINVDKGYVFRIEDFEFCRGIFELCRWFKKNSYMLFVVTNQSGIARGYYGEDDFRKLTSWMSKEFLKHGVAIDGVKYCPHHPDALVQKYALHCGCRKPKAGMILDLKKDYNVNIENSILVGDKKSDIEAAVAAGINYRYLITNHPQKDRMMSEFENLYDLLEHVKLNF